MLNFVETVWNKSDWEMGIFKIYIIRMSLKAIP